MRLKDLSIQRKLVAIIMLTTFLALVLAASAFFTYDLVAFRDKMVRDFQILAATLQATTVNALVTNDRTTARQNLAALTAQPHVVAAWVFDRDGDIFASYGRAAGGAAASSGFASPPDPVPAGAGHDFRDGHLVLHRGIEWNGRRAGTFFIVSDLTERDERMVSYLGILLAIIAGVSVIALIVSARLQRLVSSPIRDLAAVARGVSVKRDYSVRASKRADDEVGELIDGFNDMLVQIEKRDEDLRVARDRAEQANRAKSVFLANMSHELRTPLTAIIGYSEILEDDAVEMGLTDFEPDLQKIQTAGKHLLGLINSILDLSKIEAGKMDLFIEKIDVLRLVTDVAETVKPLADKGGNTLEIRCPEDIGSIASDVTKTRQILLNLLSNACKFTADGHVTMEVGRDGAGPGERLVVRVRDTGIGMTPDELSRLFKPFSQADTSTARNYGGTGLGLALCKRFAALMGGGIEVDSTKGEGSIFTIYMPVEVRPDAPKSLNERLESGAWRSPSHNTGASNEPTDPGNGRRVLVIDDDLAVHELLADILKKEGFQVLSARSGEDGIQLARDKRPDLITLDVNMPGEDGWTVLNRLKMDPDLAEIPVVMLTVDEDRKRGYALGAAEYLTKPIERTRLSAVLARFREASAGGDSPLGLVVDDDPDIRRLLSGLLAEQGWRVEEAEDGVAALRSLARHTPTLVLLDLLMPQMDGFGFLAQMRKNPAWKSIPVVVLTGMDLGPEERARLNGGVASVLRKNACTVDELEGQIRALLQAGPYEVNRDV